MLSVHIEKMGDIAVIGCEGRIVHSESAFKLRDAVTSQLDARVIVLDLSEVHAIEGGGLGMLCFLQLWAHDREILLKLVNPADSLRERLERTNLMLQLDIASLEEMMALLTLGDSQGLAAGRS
jgi:anti-anti-sigma regulatory factor